MKKQSESSRASVQRRRFLQQVFTGVGLIAAGTSTRTFGADAPRPRGTEDPYATTNAVPRIQGKPPQFKEKLKITRLETFLVKPRYLFLKVHTDAGIVGLGEPVLEGRAKTCAEAVAEIASYLVVKDPRNVIHHWQAIYLHGFYRGAPLLTSPRGGFERPLWHIKGK